MFYNKIFIPSCGSFCLGDVVLSEGKVGKHQKGNIAKKRGQKEAGSQNRPMMCSCENGSSGSE